MSVFTIFFCGTGSNSFDFHNPNYPDGELVSTLASHHSGSEFVDWVVVDGPGSGNLQEDDKWVTPGNYSSTRGKLLGAGWDENVKHALAMLKGEFSWSREKLTEEQYDVLKAAGVPIDDATQSGWIWRTYDYGNRKVTPQELQAKKAQIFRKNQEITTVNLIGWSRGGVTCHMMANAMAMDNAVKNIPVNIFAIDPVPGAGNFQSNRTTVPANVDNYVGIYARDERSAGFAPTVPDYKQRTRPTVMPFPGRHATVVGNGALDGGDGAQALPASGKLVRHLAETYLTSWGTTLDKKLELSKERMQALYAEIVADADKYAAMRDETYTYKTSVDGERGVGKGSDWISTAFSAIRGDTFLRREGLAPVGDYLSWHHKEIDT